eukprot:263656-Chlamydomonas_euryale.AAC.1
MPAHPPACLPVCRPACLLTRPPARPPAGVRGLPAYGPADTCKQACIQGPLPPRQTALLP